MNRFAKKFQLIESHMRFPCPCGEGWGGGAAQKHLRRVLWFNLNLTESRELGRLVGQLR
jgi:hypothetical protein